MFAFILGCPFTFSSRKGIRNRLCGWNFAGFGCFDVGLFIWFYMYRAIRFAKNAWSRSFARFAPRRSASTASHRMRAASPYRPCRSYCPIRRSVRRSPIPSRQVERIGTDEQGSGVHSVRMIVGTNEPRPSGRGVIGCFSWNIVCIGFVQNAEPFCVCRGRHLPTPNHEEWSSVRRNAEPSHCAP